MIVTSFGPSGYESYGKQFIKSYFDQGNDHPLAIYAEGEEGVDQVSKDFPYSPMAILDLFQIPGVTHTLDEMEKNKTMQGYFTDHEGNEHQTWRMDAFRYCRKVFAFCHEIQKAMSSDGEKSAVYWLDADIIFTAKIPDRFDDLVMPRRYALSFLGRSNMHSETGFMGIDANHKMTRRLVSLYQGLYLTGAFVDLREWHDCYIFDHARRLTMMPEIDLTTDAESLYPFDGSVLSNWMTHHKGPARKSEVYGAQGTVEAQDDR